eukprot:8167224-Pyramimonas_sp.AAC.1
MSSPRSEPQQAARGLGASAPRPHGHRCACVAPRRCLRDAPAWPAQQATWHSGCEPWYGHGKLDCSSPWPWSCEL